MPWWKDWRWTAPPKDFLPEDGAGGFIVYDETIPVCAGYMYVTNSKVGWCDWVVSNFKYTLLNKSPLFGILKDIISLLFEDCVKSDCIIENCEYCL